LDHCPDFNLLFDLVFLGFIRLAISRSLASRALRDHAQNQSQGERCRPFVPFAPAPLRQAPLNHVLDVLKPGQDDLGLELLGGLQLNGFEINSLPRRNKVGFA
jgi:hypothetical protein